MYRPLAFLLFLTGCGASHCPGGAGQPMRIYDLYFGRAVSGRGEVTAKEWRDFRDQIVTPALPNGFTVLDGQGAWMNPRTRATIAEATKVLEVALPDEPESLTAINRIRAAWQRRFRQYAAGMTVVAGCGSFSPSEAPR